MTSSAWLPIARTRPTSITMIRSAMVTVDSRCATTSTVVAGGVRDRLAQGRLVDGVQLRRRLVEQQQARPAQQRAGDGDTLALAAGEFRAPMPDRGLEVLGQAGHQVVEPGRAQHRAQFLLAHVGGAP